MNIPSAINGLQVTSIGGGTFQYCTNLTSVTIPNSVTDIGDYAFSGCTRLTSVYFEGNAPGVGPEVFRNAEKVTVYYLPKTKGWRPIFGGRPTVLWDSQIETSGASFGVRANQFGVNINGASDLVIVVEASTSLANPIWSPISTNTLTGGTSYFTDPQWANYPTRFYRLRSP